MPKPGSGRSLPHHREAQSGPRTALNLKPSNIAKLQWAQNQCLRVCSGAHAAASMEHLHHESEIMPVGDHLDMLSRQFLAKLSSPITLSATSPPANLAPGACGVLSPRGISRQWRPSSAMVHFQELLSTWRSTLCQLRSGFCRSLNSFTAVLNNGDPTCPECGSGPHTTGNLFKCAANSLACEVIDL